MDYKTPGRMKRMIVAEGARGRKFNAESSKLKYEG
jgi:hypothetical protein